MASYREWLPSIAPAAFKRPQGQAYLAQYGAEADAVVARAKAAIEARAPGAGPSDALPFIGAERQIIRGPGDTDDSYAERLRRAWETWELGGKQYGILMALRALGYTATNGDPLLVQVNGLGYQLTDSDATDGSNIVLTDLGGNPNLPGNPPWWMFDSDLSSGAFWSKFALVFPSIPSGWTDIQNPPTPSTAPTLDEVNLIRRVVNKWKGAKATFVAIAVITGGELWGWPVGTWGDPGVWGGSSVEWTTIET